MNLLSATVTQPPRQVSTKFGDRVVIDCIAQNREVTIWRRGGDDYALSLKVGQKVSITEDSKGKYNLVDNIEPYSQENPKNPDIGQNGRSDEIKDYISRLGKLYAYCYKTAVNEMGPYMTESEDLRTISTTFFIQAVKHFDL
jgi:hypothetical protein